MGDFESARSMIRRTALRMDAMRKALDQELDIEGVLAGPSREELDALEEAVDPPPPESKGGPPEWWAPLMRAHWIERAPLEPFQRKPWKSHR